MPLPKTGFFSGRFSKSPNVLDDFVASTQNLPKHWQIYSTRHMSRKISQIFAAAVADE